MKTVAAGKFKATCLALLDEVKARREEVVVTKNGKPIAKLVPLEADDDPLAVFRFPGKVEIHGDLMAPLCTDEEVQEFEERSARQLI
jgi:prevent-host-death family protein